MGKMMCEWMLEQGGLVALEELAIRRSNMLYDLIDDSNGFYKTFVTEPTLRSRMNIVFTIKSGEGSDSQVSPTSSVYDGVEPLRWLSVWFYLDAIAAAADTHALSRPTLVIW